MTDKNYTLITKAYSNYNGCYIGDEKFAEKLLQMGINPEPSYPDHDYCSIGFCEKEQKWYGWSHRAIYGFGVGSCVKKGNIGYNASNEEEWVESLVNFWRDEETQNWIRYFIEYMDDNVALTTFKILVIEYEYNDVVPNKSLHGTIGRKIERIPETFGRGEWTAETLDDAKQMAIDFADNIA